MAPNKRWPEFYGFGIAGDGPAYVISVDRGSIAHNAGIMPGDQLLELDGHNVTDMSAEAIRTLAKHSHSVPPTIGVVSRIQYVELLANRRYGYGLSLVGTRPVVVESIQQSGPAFQAGMRKGTQRTLNLYVYI